MLRSSWHRFVKRLRPASRPASRRPQGTRLHCEELEPRLQPSVFHFSTGVPDGRIATISEPPNAHNSRVEFETADDFFLDTETVIRQASFTGLLTGGATRADVNDVFLTIYRVFPNDSDLNRTPQVPSRVNSPADNEIENFDSAAGDLHFRSRLLNPSFTAENSVSSADKISVNSGGNGAVTGEEVEFEVTFKAPLDLPAGHYFFVPKVGLSGKAPAAADFLWLSAPRPIAPPGTPFPAGATDLQTWMREDPGLAPDWLRVGADIISGTTFNGSFALSGHTVKPRITSLSQTSVVEGSADLTITVTGSNFTNLSTVQVNGHQPLATRLVNANQLQAVIPAALLADEGHFRLSVLDTESGSSNAERFTVTESVPVLTVAATQGQTFQQITLDGQVSDQGVEDHRVRIRWGDGEVQVLDLGVNSGAPFSVTHTFAASKHPHHDTIVVLALDDEGVASAPLQFDVIL
jgi:hypothetical protein